VPKRWLIGLASGSSGDGVDAALLEAEGVGLELRVHPVLAVHQPYARDLRNLITQVAASVQSETKHAGLLHRLLGETFAAAARQVADRASLSLQKVQCLGCPGHTVWHEAEGRFPSTLALGMAAVVAERTGVTTVSDFCSRDLVVGGLGAPPITLPDYLLFHHPEENRALIHLGSLARLTYLPAGGRLAQTLSFDVCPCNALLDGLMQQLTAGKEAFDQGGKHGVQGCCIEALLQRWHAHSYFLRRPPKSMARQNFAGEFVSQAVQMAHQASLSLHDVVCTATHFVSRTIGEAIRRFLPKDVPLQHVLLSGGGVRNGLLWHLLEQQLAGITLDKTDRFGVPSEARKALGFGMLAALTMDGVPANVPSSTGAAGARILGTLTPGSSANWARCLNWMAAQMAPLASEE